MGLAETEVVPLAFSMSDEMRLLMLVARIVFIILIWIALKALISWLLRLLNQKREETSVRPSGRRSKVRRPKCGGSREQQREKAEPPVELLIDPEKKQAHDERDRWVRRPVPPDIKRDMRDFLRGDFVGNDYSPLAYVGYRVGKTRGLSETERHRRLDACFRVEIPNELAAKYGGWGKPVSYQRYYSISQHLKMLANMRSGQERMQYAVADWDDDHRWFSEEFKKISTLMYRFPPN